LWLVEINPALICEIVWWVLGHAESHSVPPALTSRCVDNVDDCGEKKSARVKNFCSDPKWHEPCSTEGTQLHPGTPKNGNAGVTVVFAAQGSTGQRSTLASGWLAPVQQLLKLCSQIQRSQLKSFSCGVHATTGET